jgi:hypothetical protein
MKPALRATVLLAVGCLAGAIAARFYYTHLFDEISEEWLYQNHKLSIIADVNRLTAFRRGDTNFAITDIEEALSTEIMLLYTQFPAQSLSDKDCRRTLQIVARYRSQHPYKTGSAETDRLVEEILAKVQGSDLRQVPASTPQKETPATKGDVGSKPPLEVSGDETTASL